jgi:hypothetical protein
MIGYCYDFNLWVMFEAFLKLNIINLKEWETISGNYVWTEKISAWEKMG